MVFSLYPSWAVMLLIISDSTFGQETQTNISIECFQRNIGWPNECPSMLPPNLKLSTWCPKGYTRLTFGGKNYTACEPVSCHKMSKNAGMSCQHITARLKSCPKLKLHEGEYQFANDGSLVDKYRNTTSSVGDYFVGYKTAIVCGQDTNENIRAKLPSWCMSFEVREEGYTITHDKRLFVKDLKDQFDRVASKENGTVLVCTDLGPNLDETCKQKRICEHHMEVLPNWDIRCDSKTYRRGEYFMAEDKSWAIICTTSDASSGLKRHVTIAGFLISSFCLLLALLAHLFYPKLNYHAKSLLCFAFSLMVMYIAMTVRYLSGNFESPAANLTLFAVQYIFTLAAFFWLNVLAYQLWRVFSNLRGTATTNSSRKEKYYFFAKCVYAWGIPTVLCIIIIILTYKPKMQNYLGLKLRLQETNWLEDRITALIVIYTPVIIVLLENMVFFILTVVNLRKVRKGTTSLNNRNKVNTKLFQVFVKLFLVMGICWLAEVIAFLTSHATSKEIWYATDIINSLQGMLIFLIYVCKKKTVDLIKRKFGNRRASSSQTKTSMSSSQDRARRTPEVLMKTLKIKETTESLISPTETNETPNV